MELPGNAIGKTTHDSSPHPTPRRAGLCHWGREPTWHLSPRHYGLWKHLPPPSTSLGVSGPQSCTFEDNMEKLIPPTHLPRD